MISYFVSHAFLRHNLFCGCLACIRWGTLGLLSLQLSLVSDKALYFHASCLPYILTMLQRYVDQKVNYLLYYTLVIFCCLHPDSQHCRHCCMHASMNCI